MSEYKDQVIKLLKDSKYSHLMKTWGLVHKLITAIDGRHNRLMGLGIKNYSLKAFDAVGELIGSLTHDWPDEINSEDKLKAILANALPDTKDPYTVDATHTDAGEKETALALKYRQRARVAEEALKESDRQNKIMREALKDIQKTQRRKITDGVDTSYWIATQALNQIETEGKSK
jgi:hypothetical protein